MKNYKVLGVQSTHAEVRLLLVLLNALGLGYTGRAPERAVEKSRTGIFLPLTTDWGVPFEVAHLRSPDTTLQASLLTRQKRRFEVWKQYWVSNNPLQWVDTETVLWSVWLCPYTFCGLVWKFCVIPRIKSALHTSFKFQLSTGQAFFLWHQAQSVTVRLRGMRLAREAFKVLWLTTKEKQMVFRQCNLSVSVTIIGVKVTQWIIHAENWFPSRIPKNSSHGSVTNQTQDTEFYQLTL